MANETATIRQAAPATPARHVNHWHIPVIGLLLLVGGVGVVWWWLRPTTAVHYQTQAVTRGAVARGVTASGTVNPVITVQVGTYVSGVIKQRFCDFNTEVKAGQMCAKIDDRPYAATVAQDRANLNVAKAQLAKDTASLTYAKIAFERNQTLVAKQAVSLDALDSSRSAYDQAKAQVDLDQATIDLRQASLDAATINLDYTNIRSPVDGVVVSRSVEMGQTVAASFQTPTLFLIATDLTKMQVDTNVSESDIGSLEIGDKASFTVESFSRKPFSGVVTQIRQAPQTIQNVVTYDAVVAAPNPDFLLKPGMTATVRLITDRRDDVIRVPDQALRYVPGGALLQPAAYPDASAARVYVLRDGAPVAVAVEIGLDDDTNTEIVKGDVRVGDLVIVGEQATAPAATTQRPSAPRAPRL